MKKKLYIFLLPGLKKNYQIPQAAHVAIEHTMHCQKDGRYIDWYERSKTIVILAPTESVFRKLEGYASVHPERTSIWVEPDLNGIATAIAIGPYTTQQLDLLYEIMGEEMSDLA